MDDQTNLPEDDESAIAIIGLACHLPGALNIEEYWNNLRDGIESVRFYTDEELLSAGESAANLAHPNYVRAQPNLENYDRFDAGFWGFSPQDAAVTDPAHRLFLEVAYESLEHAGHTGYDDEGRVGVFAGSGASLYWMQNLASNPKLIEDMGEFLVRHTGNDMNFLATRFSYELDLRGPSINVQTACSSALVSVHMATQSLLSGECDMAIAGGSTMLLPQKRGYIFRDGEILSPDGHCRPFDAKSAGTVFGSGAGAVVLKRMEDALADGDTIHAIVRGTAINNDGAQKIGFLAPSVDGQAGAIAEALTISGIDAGDVSYIETHGTGTQVGDPIEFEAINQVFREATDKRNYCRIGSVKSNIGHLGEAAGAAAIIKVILSLQNKSIPASLNYESPNPQLDLTDSPFIINNKLTPWQVDGPRIAGITALGAGGTNAYVLLEESPDTEPPEESQHSKQLLVVSAKSPTALDNACRNLAVALDKESSLNLADVAHTLQIGRRSYYHRRAIACDNITEAIALLENGSSKRSADAICNDQEPSLVFMFPGGGAQYAGMGQELYKTENVYRESFDACMNCLDPDFATKLKELIFASDDSIDHATKELQRPSLTLTALFATEYALAKQLLSWGAKPAALIGHSMGENTAACIAGVMRLEDAMKLVLIRGQLFEKAPAGGMLAISLSQEDAKKHMPKGMDFAAINAPELCVASGSVDDIDSLQTTLEEKEIDCNRVRIEVAAHSRMLEVILDDFRTYLQSIPLSPPQIPFTSNLSGGWITDEQATDPNYWVDHLRNTVRFADNIATVLEDDARFFVEIGPGRTLTNLSLAAAGKETEGFIGAVNSMRHPNEDDSDVEFALRTLGNIWAHGVNIDWKQYRGDEMRSRVPLPTYPFERKVYWVDPGKQSALQNSDDEVLKKRPDSKDWFAQLNWQQTGLAELKESIDNHWLIFSDELGVSNALISQLNIQHNLHSVDSENKPPLVITTISKGNQFNKINDHSFQLNPNSSDDFESLLQAVFETKTPPQHIVYLWPTTDDSTSPTIDSIESQLTTSFWGLFNLSKMLGELDDSVTLSVISSDMQSIGGQPTQPGKALLAGPVTVLPHEFIHVQTKSIDIHLANSQAHTLGKIASQLVRELRSDTSDRFVAYRGSERWTRQLTPTTNDSSAFESSWLPANSSILITGGLGGIGLKIAKQLATQHAKNILLVSRSGLPEKEKWQSHLDNANNKNINNDNNDATSTKIRAIQEIEALGCNVLILAADVTDQTALKNAIDSAVTKIGNISGVIHAAGSMDDQLVMMKSRESAETIINAKVLGAIHLDSILADTPLDFFVVFSSVASFIGLPGQIDYAAANAFLDAFARDRSERTSGRTLAINWNAWAEVGMAAQVLNDTGSNTGPLTPVDHPIFDGFCNLNSEERQYTTHFNLTDHWLLSEHITKLGASLIPGTGYIELLRAAFADSIDVSSTDKQSIIELSDVHFLSAFQVEKNDTRTLNILTEGSAENMSMTIFSETEDMPHATGVARLLPAPPTKTTDLRAIRTRCTKTASTQGKFMDQVFMNFGPRWGCINGISYTDKEALVDIELPEAFIHDLDDYKIHPGLLDMATGSTQFLLDSFSNDEDFYVPVAYDRMTIISDMPKVFVSHIRLQESSAPGFANFDITLMNESGEAFVEINGFTMKKVDADFSTNQTTELKTDSESTDTTEEIDPLEAILREAILPHEGVKVFDQIMAQQHGSAQWIISSVDSDLWLRQLDNAQLQESSGSGITSFLKEDIHDPDADPDIATVEQLLTKHEGIESAIVRSHLDDNGRRRLIAHFVPDDMEHVTVTEIRKYAKANLDASLLPQQFIEIDELELDEQGQVDRSLLLDPFAPVDNYIPPQTPTEKKLAKIWQNVVGVNRVSLIDNFFDIGGHSLVSIRAIVKVKKEFGVRLDQAKMVLLTLEQMAQEIDDQREASGTPKEKLNKKDSMTANNTTATQPSSNTEPEKPKKGLFKSFFGRK